MSQIQSNLSIGNMVELKTQFPISIDGENNIEYQRKERNGFVYSGTVRQKISEDVYQITLDSYFVGNLATIKVSLKENYEYVVQLNETKIENNKIVRLTINRPMDVADGG